MPFGKSKKLEQGFCCFHKRIVSICNKEIAQIDEEGLTKENIELAILMARRYFCNISDCLKLMLPPGTCGKKIENKVKEKKENCIFKKRNRRYIIRYRK